MALGVAYTAVNIKQAGGRRIRIGTFTADATYADGGYAVTAAALGLSAIEAIVVGGAAVTGASDNNWLALWDPAASKVKFVGSGTADGPLKEADTNEASLTGSIATFIAVGY